MGMVWPQRFAGRSLCFMATILCQCLLIQMLGVPVTLMQTGDVSDAISASVLGWVTVPPTLPKLMMSSDSIPFIEVNLFQHVPGFRSTLFRPPAR